jgi:hypothetical protein
VTTPTTTLTTTPRAFRTLRADLLAAPLAAILTCLVLVPAAGAQVCGDVNADEQVSASDAQLVLKAAVGQDVNLVCQDCSALEARVAALESLLANLSIDGDNLVLTGMNFQVVSGSGETDGDVNGTGNIIIGYDEKDDNQDEKSGSHNLVIGRDHSYESYGGIVAGEDNVISRQSASVLGGSRNSADGAGAVVVGGQLNRADGLTSVVVAGETNRTTGRSSSVGGGSSNLCSSVNSVIGGGSNRTLGGVSPGGWMAATLGPLY